MKGHHHHCRLHQEKGSAQQVLGASRSPEDAVAPEEDMDMDLDADRLVLLSLPVKHEVFLLICFYKLRKRQDVRCKLTFSVSVFFGIHLVVVLLSLQMFLSRGEVAFRERRCFQQTGGVGSHSPFPAAESPPSPSSGPVNPSPASCETVEM